ncbi:MAG: nitronate monooxygenase [Alphaproteobacteria bacterium]|nr:nitronate monooxygenase [Alphaproteobacteria bacterium]
MNPPQPSLRTRITDLFAIRHPILCGGLNHLAIHDYVGAVVNAGAMGFITPRSYASDAAFRDGLKRCAEITGGWRFGVNLYVSARPEQNEALKRFMAIAIEEGVRYAETAGYRPDAFLPALKAAGVTVVHKCTTLRHALAAEKAGVDAVTILGMEAGGHPGMRLVGGIVQGALVPRALGVPVVLGGGIGTGRQLVAALALGADGVLMGSRMTVASEVWAHPDYKRRVIEADEGATRVVMGIFGDNSRVLDNRTAREVGALEADGITDFERYRPLVRGPYQREAYETGDWERGTLSLGQSCVFADRIAPVAEILEEIMAEAVAVRDRIAALNGRQS